MPKEPIEFECPVCKAQHQRGLVNGVDTFRCLRCGYMGHGFHPDPEIDHGVFLDHQEANRCNRALGIPEEQPIFPVIHG